LYRTDVSEAFLEAFQKTLQVFLRKFLCFCGFREPIFRPTVRFALVLEGHGIAEVVVTIGNPSAVEADILRIPGQFFDFVNPVIAGQNTQMSLMIAPTLAFFHFGSYYFVFRQEFQPHNHRNPRMRGITIEMAHLFR
jgi:hypothetical protein